MIRDFEQWSPRVEDALYIDPQATVIGRVELGRDVSIWPQAVLRGDVNHISVGARSNIQDGSVLHVTHVSEYAPGRSLSVGENVTVGHSVTLHGCEVQDECLIGMGSTVLDGAVIESGVILGAGSLVTQNSVLSSGYLWLGSPARKLRELTDAERTFLRYSAQHYVELATKYAAARRRE